MSEVAKEDLAEQALPIYAAIDIFETLNIEQMQASQVALREGLILEMLKQ